MSRFGFFDGLFNRFTGFTRAPLNAAQQFVMLAFDALEVVVGEAPPFLFELAFRDIPIALYFKCCHMILSGLRI